LPLGTQARLLRVLETGEYIRVGSSKVQRTDVRVVAATNRELLERVQEGKFREDLYYRLNTVPIRVPALRDRSEDIHLLFRKFSADFANKYKAASIQLDEEAQKILNEYPWPGNVRELKNIAEQISVLAKDKKITGSTLKQFLPQSSSNRMPILAASAGHTAEFANEREILYKLFFDMKKDVTELKRLFLELIQNPELATQHPTFVNELQNLQVATDSIRPMTLSNPGIHTTSGMPVAAMPTPLDAHVEVEESLNILDKEKELILKALKKHKSKRKDAAADLGISERTLYRKLKEYNIEE